MSSGRTRLARKFDRQLGAERAAVVRMIGRRADDREERAFLVGGVVRDLLLARTLQDLDVAIEGDALDLARRLSEELGATLRIHRRFETATIGLPGPWHIDLARSRSERYDRPAMLPRILPAPIEADLRRRDFTVNCLALDLSPDQYGRLLDPLNGRRDLEGRAIRVLHERSFFDDPTRAFRAVRFAVRLGFDLDAPTLRQIRRAIGAQVFEALSAARLRREIGRLFDEADWERIGKLMIRTGLWGTVDRGLVGKPVRGLARIESALRRSELAKLLSESEPWSLALAWVMQGSSAAAIERLIGRLHPSRSAVRTLREAGRDAHRLASSLRRAVRPSPGRVHGLCSATSPEALALALAIGPERVRRLVDTYLRDWHGARADVDGSDLLAAGIRPGPAIARGLAAALRAKLDGRADDRSTQLRVAVRAARRA